MTDSVKKKEVLKGWASSQGCSYFKENLRLKMDLFLVSLRNLDLMSDTEQGKKDRVKASQIQAKVNAMTDILNEITSYTMESGVVKDETKDLV